MSAAADLAEGSYFLPSADRARECRFGMEKSLWSSVAKLLIPLRADITAPSDVRATPLDFGAYCDLALPYPTGSELPDSIKSEAAHYLLIRFTGTTAHHVREIDEKNALDLPRISTLCDRDHTVSDIARYKRWWDIEPENSMGLIAVPEAQMLEAQEQISKAFVRLRQSVPSLHDEIMTIVQDVVIAVPDGDQHLEFSGVSSFALWGAIAINSEAHDSWPTYLRTIVHEAAHNLLFGLARIEPLVDNAPTERRISPLRGDFRPLDGIYHAAYVSARESFALDQLLSWNEESGELSQGEVETIELLLEASVIAFWDCAETLHHEAHLTNLGTKILAHCEDFMRGNFALQY